MGLFVHGDFLLAPRSSSALQHNATRVSSSPGVLEPGRRPSEGPKTSGQGEGPRCFCVGEAKVLHWGGEMGAWPLKSGRDGDVMENVCITMGNLWLS